MSYGCPICAGHIVLLENSLKSTHPHLAKQWDYDKNKISILDVAKGSGRIVWWLCDYCNHSWKAQIHKRASRGDRCPNCSTKSSKIELTIYHQLNCLIGGVENRKIIKNNEIDIYIADKKFGIEIDSYFYHKNKLDKEKKKNSELKSEGIQLLRVRETPLKKISSIDILADSKTLYGTVDKKLVIRILKRMIELKLARPAVLNNYINHDGLLDNEGLMNEITRLPRPLKENSLGAKYPEIGSEWASEKNGWLTPFDVAPFSHKEAWFICSNNHTYKTKITNRTTTFIRHNGNGCKICAKKYS